MRDLLVTAIVFGSLPFILRRPWIGIMMWVWLGLMNPHRLTWGFAFTMPFAMLVAATTILAIFLSKEKYKLPICSVTVTLLALSIWMSITTLFAIHPAEAIPQWEKVMKIQIMNFVGLYVLSTRKHIEALAWMIAVSIGFFGIKGGIFTILGGGGERVYGPLGSFIEENNSLALATIMIIPILYYLMLRSKQWWMRMGLLGASILCGFSVLGSHSRGALLAVAAMIGFLWLKSKHKVASFIVLLLLVPPMIGFMPDHWTERMHSISKYEQDSSAQGRINAWSMVLNLVKERPITGGGFQLYSEYSFGRWAPNPTDIHSAHSNYFQMLGEHGHPGLILFLLVLLLTWRMATQVIRKTKGHAEFVWASDLCRMIQVGIVGYAVGGLFLNLAYFDLPYFMITLVVLTRQLVERELVDPAGQVQRDSKGHMIKDPGARSNRPQTA